MAHASPSEFLTFFKRASTSQALRQQALPGRCSVRPFTSSLKQSAERQSKKADIGGPDKDSRHTLEKGFDPNVQTQASQQAREHRAEGTGGVATEQKSSNKSKESFPEAPDAIGFQDERGGKGH